MIGNKKLISNKMKKIYNKQFFKGYAIKISPQSSQTNSNLLTNNITHIHGTDYSGLTAGKKKKKEKKKNNLQLDSKKNFLLSPLFFFKLCVFMKEGSLSPSQKANKDQTVKKKIDKKKIKKKKLLKKKIKILKILKLV